MKVPIQGLFSHVYDSCLLFPGGAHRHHVEVVFGYVSEFTSLSLPVPSPTDHYIHVTDGY